MKQAVDAMLLASGLPAASLQGCLALSAAVVAWGGEIGFDCPPTLGGASERLIARLLLDLITLSGNLHRG